MLAVGGEGGVGCCLVLVIWWRWAVGGGGLYFVLLTFLGVSDEGLLFL